MLSILRSYTPVLFVVFLCLSNVFAAPLNLNYVQGAAPAAGSTEEQSLNKNLISANKQIKLMKETVDAATKAVTEKRLDDPHLAKIIAVFTSHYNLPEIKRIVYDLYSTTVTISAYATDLGTGVLAEVSPQTKHLQISKIFYNPPFLDIHRTGVLIHEASHIFGPTFDIWNKVDGKLVPVSISKFKEGESIKGYWLEQYDEVVKQAPELLHKNADTWAVFGFYLQYGMVPPKTVGPSRRSLPDDAQHYPSIHARTTTEKGKTPPPPPARNQAQQVQGSTNKKSSTVRSNSVSANSSSRDGAFVEHLKDFLPSSQSPKRSPSIKKTTPIKPGRG